MKEWIVTMRIKVTAESEEEAGERALNQVIDPNAEVDDVEELP